MELDLDSRRYLERDAATTLVRPWVWILAIVIGPFLTDVFYQLYVFLAVRDTLFLLSLIPIYTLRLRREDSLARPDRGYYYLARFRPRTTHSAKGRRPRQENRCTLRYRIFREQFTRHWRNSSSKRCD